MCSACGCDQVAEKSVSPNVSKPTSSRSPSDEQIQQAIELAYRRAVEPPRYLQHVALPDKRTQFALYTEIRGLEDVTWYVFKLDGAVDAKDLDVPKSFRTGSSQTEKMWKDRVVFWNWSEAGFHRSNPRLLLIDDRFLLFERGGLYHAAYDIHYDRVLVTSECPWGDMMSEQIVFDKGGSFKIGFSGTNEEQSARMDSWVRKHLHEPIENIIGRRTRPRAGSKQ